MYDLKSFYGTARTKEDSNLDRRLDYVWLAIVRKRMPWREVLYQILQILESQILEKGTILQGFEAFRIQWTYSLTLTSSLFSNSNRTGMNLQIDTAEARAATLRLLQVKPAVGKAQNDFYSVEGG